MSLTVAGTCGRHRTAKGRLVRKACQVIAWAGGALVVRAAGDDSTINGCTGESRNSVGPGESVRHPEERALSPSRSTHG